MLKVILLRVLVKLGEKLIEQEVKESGCKLDIVK